MYLHLSQKQTNKRTVEGYIVYRNHPVRLSVNLFTFCPDIIFLLPCPIWIIFYTFVVYNLRVCHDLEPRSYPRSRSLCTHSQNPCLGQLLTSILDLDNISHIVVHDARVCHDLGSKLYLQGKKSQNPKNTQNLCLCHNSSLPLFQAIVHVPRKCYSSRPYFSRRNFDLDDYYNCCPWPRGCHCKGGFVLLGHV